MHLDSATVKNGDKAYTRHLLQETYREGKKVKHRTIANLSHCKPEEIEAIRLALRHKKDLAGMLGENRNNISQSEAVSFKQGLWLLYAMARQLGIAEALGTTKQGKLALSHLPVANHPQTHN